MEKLEIFSKIITHQFLIGISSYLKCIVERLKMGLGRLAGFEKSFYQSSKIAHLQCNTNEALSVLILNFQTQHTSGHVKYVTIRKSLSASLFKRFVGVVSMQIKICNECQTNYGAMA
jgi:hypothetical protein